jgi:uroporphyrin-3 C-methyltransferase
VSEQSTPSPAPRRRRLSWLWLPLLVLALLALAGWHGWTWWQAREASDRAAVASADHRIDALSDRLDALRSDQRANSQRLQQADATNRVLRDELLGLGERAALLEESVTKLGDPSRSGVQTLRLEEVELLLVLGQQRLEIAGDLAGAQRSYALAGSVLDAVKDTEYLSLRQSLMQERAALDALGSDPRVQALAQLDAFAEGLDQAPSATTSTAPAGDEPWWRRALSNVFDIQPRDRVVAELPSDRADALAALQLELTLARAAAERRDNDGYRAALTRVGAWLARLWPPSPALETKQAELGALAARPLSLQVPTLGSTLQQLRQLRAAR